MRETGPERLDSDAVHLPDSEAGDERQHFIFYQDEGGLRATDEANVPTDTIYYLGVIDICTPYTTFKRAEHIWKGLHADRVRVCTMLSPPKLSFSNSALAPFSTRSVPWNPASTPNASALSLRQSCGMGKVVSVSRTTERNLSAADPRRIICLIIFSCKIRTYFTFRVCFRGFRSPQGFWFSWFTDAHFSYIL